MSDEKKSAATKEYVAVFDQVDVHTGDMVSQGVGMPQVAVTKSYFRGQKLSLTDEQAQRYLDDGAILPVSDKRAKLVKENDRAQGGVRRDPTIGAVALEQHEPAVAGEGAKRASAGAIGSEADLKKMSVTDLKALAQAHGVAVEKSDTKPKLAAKLAAHAAAAGDELNPGQESGEESPPPEHQPDEEPDE